jgi:hypothetical protein
MMIVFYCMYSSLIRPGFMLDVISQMRIALLDVYQVMSVDCVAYMDFFTPYWLTTSLTLFILVVAFCLHRLLPFVSTACFIDMDRNRVRDLRSLIVKYTFIFMCVLWLSWSAFVKTLTCALSTYFVVCFVDFAARFFIRP